MSNALKGMLAGFVATLVLTALCLLNSAFDLIPQINIIRLLTTLGTLSVPSAWMDHFIVGAVVWGLLFAVYDGAATRPAPWLKGPSVRRKARNAELLSDPCNVEERAGPSLPATTRNALTASSFCLR